MLTHYERELSNLSYTNKDFSQIYPELLDLAKKLSYKWDPTLSDESDPGVVLLKLAALIGDKNNYNIDKNILELYPLSVTQEANARQLFEQLGYFMKYYQSAETLVTLSLLVDQLPEIKEEDYSILGISAETDLKNDPLGITYKLDRFTMICNSDADMVYTLTDEVILNTNEPSISVTAMQGTANKYTINGETLITSLNLDYNNRLYFTETDIAENGIFITDPSGHNDWVKVDNLLIQPVGTKCYKFGVTEDGLACYIEFPNDIDTLIGSGITITYIRTLGVEGNIGRSLLRNFFVDTKATRYHEIGREQTVTVTNENISIYNPYGATNGRNPESIESAYKEYQKVKNTFKTLVSLNDYNNFMITNKNVSNGYVCDRTNDIQSSYKILASDMNNKEVIVFNKDANNNPEMTAFDLKVYALSYVDNCENEDRFTQSFKVITDDISTITDMYNLQVSDKGWKDLKTIQHEFISYIPYRILMLKNKYFMDAKIIPEYKVTALQETDIINKIRTKLFNSLNSQELKFGEAIEYNIVYDTIMNADPRIKALILQDITYETYAIYKDSEGVIQELRIDENSSEPTDKDIQNLWKSFRDEIYVKSVLAGKTQFLTSASEFKHTIKEGSSISAQDIYYVDTNTSYFITKDSDPDTLNYSCTHELRPNENIIFTAPNLIEDRNFSTYTKFIYKFKTDPNKTEDQNLKENHIVKDNEYTLEDTEYIIFFWKASEEDSEYLYRKYNHSSEINTFSANFNLKHSQPKFSYIYGENKKTDLYLYTIFDRLPVTGQSHSKIPEAQTFTITTPDGDLEVNANEFISNIKGGDYVLTGTRTISTKKLNKVHINNKTSKGTQFVYWFLNNKTSDNKYKLFEEGQQSYTLSNNEYFIYSNSSKTQLHLLGSGTKIERIPTSGASLPEWEVDAVNYDDFIDSPIITLEAHWKIIDENIDVYATEQQFYQIGPKYKVFLTAYRQTDITDIVFNYDNTQFKYSNDPNTWNIEVIDSEEYKSMSQFIISFTDENGNSTSLPYRNYPQYSWAVRSLLNLNASPTNAQIIYPDQTIIFKDNKNNSVFSLEPTDFNEESKVNRYLLTNRDISYTGGNNINVTAIDLIKDKEIPLNVHTYCLTSIDDNMKSMVTPESWALQNVTNDEIELEIIIPGAHLFEESNKANYIFPVMFSKGSYIIPLKVTRTLKNLQCTFFSTEVNTEWECTELLPSPEGDLIPYNTEGTHLLKLTLPDNAADQKGKVAGYMCIKFDSTNFSIDENVKLIFGAPYKYTYDFSSSSFEDILKLLSVYDLDNNNIRVFDYTYQVPKEELVKNPLIGKSFLNSNHPFNKFTICQWEVDHDENQFIIEDKIK